MTKYHIRKGGTPGICTAQPGRCPLGGLESHIEANSVEEAQRQFDGRNEKIAELSRWLRHDIHSYTDEEKAVFLAMDLDCNEQDVYRVDFDKLPESTKNKVTKAVGNSKTDDIMVIHKDLDVTMRWAAESMDDKSYEKLGSLYKSTYPNAIFNPNGIEDLEDKNLPQEYKDIYKKAIDTYVDGDWVDDYTKVPIDGEKGYLIVSK